MDYVRIPGNSDIPLRIWQIPPELMGESKDLYFWCGNWCTTTHHPTMIAIYICLATMSSSCDFILAQLLQATLATQEGQQQPNKHPPLPNNNNNMQAAHGNDNMPHYLDSGNACSRHCQVSLITLHLHLFLTREAGATLPSTGMPMKEDDQPQDNHLWVKMTAYE